MNVKRMLKRTGLVGDRAFYGKVVSVTLPIMIQNGITNFVSMLDNIMVGQVGTEQMSGVAIVNQLIFVFNICIFGAMSGAGILGAQYYGSGNDEGVRNVFRFKLYTVLAISVIGILILHLFGGQLISLYLNDADGGDIAATFSYGSEYLVIMLAGLAPFALVQMYSSTLRECGETVLPMAAGLIAVAVNMVFNYILIFGKFGAPALGVRGAAIATVLSRFVELFIVAVRAHMQTEKYPYLSGVYKSLKVPASLVAQTFRTGTPLLINETLWSGGMAVIAQCYSVRGLSVVAAVNISNTITNVFNVVFLSLGSAVGILIGQLLGAGRLAQAKDEDKKVIAFSVVCCAVVGCVLFAVAPLFPRIYNTEEEVRHLAASFIRISAVAMPVFGFTNTAYFTLRCGGRTFVTFLFDSVFVWLVNIPVVFALSYFTGLYVVYIYGACQALELVKAVIGFILVKKGVWIRKIVGEK